MMRTLLFWLIKIFNYEAHPDFKYSFIIVSTFIINYIFKNLSELPLDLCLYFSKLLEIIFQLFIIIFYYKFNSCSKHSAFMV